MKPQANRKMNTLHHWLIGRAFDWLQNQGCITTISNSGTVERPDVIGWDKNGDSILIECKASRKDLLEEWRRTERKSFRFNPGQGMGLRRYYFMPQEVLERGLSVPCLFDGWGIIVCRSIQTQVAKHSLVFERSSSAELALLVRHCSDVLPKEPPHPQLSLDFGNGSGMLPPCSRDPEKRLTRRPRESSSG